MDSFLQSEWIDYEVGDLEIPARGVHLWQIRPSRCLCSVFEFGGVIALRKDCATKKRNELWFCSGWPSENRRPFTWAACLRRWTCGAKARGKPYVPGAPEFNLSHTAGRMFAAFSLEAVGLDVESASRTVRAGRAGAEVFFARGDETGSMMRRGSEQSPNISSLLGLQRGYRKAEWGWYLLWTQICASGLGV